MYSSVVVTALALLFASALIEPSQAQQHQHSHPSAVSLTKKDDNDAVTLPTFVTFQTDDDVEEDIDPRIIGIVQDAMRSSCNKVYPKDALVSVSSTVESASRHFIRKDSNEEKEVGETSSLRGTRFDDIDDFINYSKILWNYQIRNGFFCSLCPDDDDWRDHRGARMHSAIFADALEALEKGTKGKNLRAWEKKFCEELDAYGIGFSVYDCTIDIHLPFLQKEDNGDMVVEEVQQILHADLN